MAPTLSSVEVISQPGETSTHPYPIKVMRGLWQVDPHPHGSTITMRFALQAPPTIRGGLFLLLVRLMFGRALARLFNGWERQALASSAAK